MFVFSRVSGSGGCQWLKAPDGWVLESCQRGSFGANTASGPGRVFISGLPYNMEDERITDMFSAFGPIKQFHQVNINPAIVTSLHIKILRFRKINK